MLKTEACPWCGTEVSRAKFEEIKAKIRAEEQKKATEQEAEIKKKLASDYALILAKAKQEERKSAKEETEKAIQLTLAELKKAAQTAKEAEALTKKQLQDLKKSQQESKDQAEKIQKAEIAEQRVILDREHAKELAKKDTEHKRESEKLQLKLLEFQRQMQKKTANELGEIPEIDLFESLREQYEEDHITRVKRGEHGADIHQTVKYRNQTCGLILLDSKNHQAWRNDFTAKLHQDKLNAKADHAILTTTVFPSGMKELCIVDKVIVVAPTKATHIVHILREAMINLHKLKLSQHERNTKVEQLYQMITSDQFAQRLSETVRLSDSILALDVEEKKQHDKTWKQRGTITTKLKNALVALDDEIHTILGGEAAQDEFEGQQVTSDEGIPF